MFILALRFTLILGAPACAWVGLQVGLSSKLERRLMLAQGVFVAAALVFVASGCRLVDWRASAMVLTTNTLVLVLWLTSRSRRIRIALRGGVLVFVASLVLVDILLGLYGGLALVFVAGEDQPIARMPFPGGGECVVYSYGGMTPGVGDAGVEALVVKTIGLGMERVLARRRIPEFGEDAALACQEMSERP
jgi:hypothetical protein